MWGKIKEFLSQVFTEPNNRTVCVVRLAGVGAVVQGQFLIAYHVVVQHAAFDLQAYGLGMTALITGLGVALGIKKDSP